MMEVNPHSTVKKPGCCSVCNSQICCSYLLSLMASGLIVGGFYLSYHKWDTIWLIFGSALGILLILIGTCLYYFGNKRYYRKRGLVRQFSSRRQRRRYIASELSNDQLISSNNIYSDSRTISQYSLNMIPQYFASTLDSHSTLASNFLNATPSAPSPSTRPYSQIFSVNGQSFLILPLSGEAGVNEAYPMQNILLKINENIDVEKKSEELLNSKCESKGEQACQTDDGLPKIIIRSNSNASSLRRDVQLQTLPDDRCNQTTNQLLQNSDILLCASLHQSTSSRQQENESCNLLSHENQHDLLTDSCIQQNASLLNTSANLNTSMPLINFDETSDQPTTSYAVSLPQNRDLSNMLIEPIYCDEINLEEFRYTIENDDEIDNDRATPPPSYEDVVDDENACGEEVEHLTEESSISLHNYDTL